MAEKLLGERKVANAKPKATPYRLNDGGGLTLRVMPHGAKYWHGINAATLPSALIVNAALSGLLSRFFETPVNAVNAPLLAKDNGIEVREERTTQKTQFATLVTVTIVSADGKRATASGTLGGDRTTRLVKWGKFEMEAYIDGSVLVVKNNDKPGVIGGIGTILGAAGINVSSMQMGLDKSQGEAAALWALDSPLSASTLEQIRNHKDVTVATAVTIG